MENGFAPAYPSDTIVFGARRPGYDSRTVNRDQVAEWIGFMKNQGVTRVCCLLSQSQLAYYPDGLLSTYQAAFGEANVCHVEVEDYHLIDKTDLEDKVLPFLRDSDSRRLPVVVHCSGGSGRTGHVLAAWLAKGRGLPADEALAVVSIHRNPREAIQYGNATERELLDLLGHA